MAKGIQTGTQVLRIHYMVIINPATMPHGELNEFTYQVKVNFEHKNSYGRSKYRVLLRNGTLAMPIYKEAEDKFCESGFYTEDFSMAWNLDGTSVKNSDYDMMQIVWNPIDTSV